MYVIPASPGDRPEEIFVPMLGGLSVVVIAAGFAVRKKMTQPALDALRTKPDDIALVCRWRSEAILSATLAEAVVLFGLVIHLWGGSGVPAAGFWIARAVTMLIWRLQAP
jgi:hypothetical protein